MAWDRSNSSNDSPEGTELAYDLRQIYAKLVGDHLNDIASARKADNYSMYFRALKDLYIIVQHKFSDDDRKDYKVLMTKASEIANKYSMEFTGEVKDSKNCAMIEEVLNEIEMFLYKKTDEANIFGKGYEWDADEV